MKKRIELCPAFCEDEAFSELKPDLIKYGFVSGGAHTNFVFAKNSVYFYASHNYTQTRRFEQACSSCNKNCNRREIRIHLDSKIIVPTVFYDRNGLERISNADIKAYRIYVNDEFAGLYCPKYHILWATDWTHMSATVKVAKQVLQILENLGILKQMKSTPIVRFPKEIVTIGVDIEFEQLSNWERYSVIRQKFADRTYAYTYPEGGAGCDGSGDQIELRPKHHYNPIIVTSNLKKLISKLNIPISVKGDRYPLGAHIHLGFKESAIHTNSEQTKLLVRLLDDFIGRLVIHLSGSARGSYKQLSAFRYKSYGIEYRTPPSAIAHNPKIFTIILKIAKHVTQHLLRNGYIEYNNPPIKEDYMKYAKLTEQEYNTLMHFITWYKTEYRGEPINRNWYTGKQYYTVAVTFSDEWHRKEVTDMISQELGRIRVRYPVTVRLFGLHMDRGIVVAGYKSEYAKTIEHGMVKWSPSYIVIGWPWNWRNEAPMEEVKKYVTELQHVLLEYLSKQNLLVSRSRRKVST